MRTSICLLLTAACFMFCLPSTSHAQVILADLETDDNASNSASVSEFAEAGVNFDSAVAALFHLQGSGSGSAQAAQRSVSYTHLTLPTSYSV